MNIDDLRRTQKAVLPPQEEEKRRRSVIGRSAEQVSNEFESAKEELKTELERQFREAGLVVDRGTKAGDVLVALNFSGTPFVVRVWNPSVGWLNVHGDWGSVYEGYDFTSGNYSESLTEQVLAQDVDSLSFFNRVTVEYINEADSKKLVFSHVVWRAKTDNTRIALAALSLVNGTCTDELKYYRRA